MRLELITGCMADSLNVDGVEEINMTDEQRVETMQKVLEWMKKHAQPDSLNNFLQFVISEYGELEQTSETPCEQCGDYVWTNVLEI